MYDIKIKKLLFLILFFDKEGFAFRYPMSTFFNIEKTKNEILNMWKNNNNSYLDLQLYIHTPFCFTRCYYCNCYTESLNVNSQIKYKDYVIQYINEYSKVISKDITSIYFGGGTFSTWSLNHMNDIINCIKNNFNISKNNIWQVEVHPVSIDKEKLQLLKNQGVNNIIVGIQTFSKELNKLNNRPYIEGRIDDLMNWLIELKFEKVSFDMMYNLPFSNEENLIYDLDKILEYGLILKKNNIKVNLEINRWDPSHRTFYLKNYIKENNISSLIDFLEDYMVNSIKYTEIVNEYIDGKFIGLFDTDRDEIEIKKQKNSAIVGIGKSATSYIPGLFAYDDLGEKFIGYNLNYVDNYNYIFLHNLRRGLEIDIFKKVLINNKKYIGEYINNIKKNLILKENKILLNSTSDLEVDIINLLLMSEESRDILFKKLLKDWEKFGFSIEDLDKNYDKYLGFYYERSKLYG